jgi:hypothetical protein
LIVPESSVKYRNFGILATILLLVGIVGGLIMGGRQVFQPGETAPLRVRLLLSGAVLVAIASLLVINVSAEMASHAHLTREHLQVEKPVVTSSGLQLELTGDSHATVGQVANLQVQAIDTVTNQPAK